MSDTALVDTHLSEPADVTVRGPTVRRVWATSVVALALIAVAMGIVARRRRGRIARTFTWMAGLVAVVNGALVLLAADGGPGTGNGVVGGAAAIVFGLIAIGLGARSR